MNTLLTTLRLSITASMLLLVAGCAPSLRVATDYDSTVDFSQFSTFDWHSEADKWPSSFFDSALREAVNDELSHLGLSRDTESPDLFVITHTSLEEVVSGHTVTHWNHGWGWYRGMGGMGSSTVQVHTVQEGTLILDLVDASSNQLVWRGIAEKAVRDARSTRELLQPIVQNLLDDFPPASSQ